MRLLAIALFTFVWPAGCSRPGTETPSGSANPTAAVPAATNRVDVPAAVRQNLGITFATVEARSVAQAIRLPGSFELLPEALREYYAMLDGRVELLVKQYQAVEPGTPLYRLDSPGWRALQRQLAEAEGEIGLADAGATTIGPLKAAHEQHEQSLRETIGLWTRRVEHLEDIRSAGGGGADEIAQARASLTAAQAELAEILEKDAELDARESQVKAELAAAIAKFDLLLATASTLLDIDAGQLAQPSPSTSEAAAPWRTIDVVEVLATTAGVVDRLLASNGSWLDQASPVLTTVQPSRVRFRARGLQSDLARLRDGLPAVIVTAQQAMGDPAARISGSLALAPLADAEQRTVDLVVTPSQDAPWARAGISAYLEVSLDGGSDELAIPLACVARDGLASVIFRRDPRNPDKVIRLEADLGIDDGRWVVVKSGVMEGDEIVLDGVYQLMVATSGTIAKGGHFHADGTFHEGDQ